MKVPYNRQMLCNRRRYLQVIGGAVGAAALRISSKADQTKFSIPGLFPGRVVGVESLNSYTSDKYQAEPIRAMMQKGMCQLTGADTWQEAWRQFFEPGDVVGIKTNPSGYPICSSPQAMAAILEGLFSARDQTGECSRVRSLPRPVRRREYRQLASQGHTHHGRGGGLQG